MDIAASGKEQLFIVDVQGWLQELPMIDEYYATFGDHLPQELRKQVADLKQRLEAA